MKAPKPKLHVINVSEPLLCFNGLVMRCGLELKEAEIVWMVREDHWADISFHGLIASRFCKACWYPKLEQSTDRRYSYACVEAAEERATLENGETL